MLKLDGVSKKYQDTVALDDINLTFPDKGLVVIKGESGSGKSTLLNLLSALDFATSGKVQYDGEEITPKNGGDFRRRYCSNIYQDYMIIQGLSVGENIELAMQASGEPYTQEDIKQLIQDVGIVEEYIDKKVSKLSGGEKQRVSIARALAKKDAIIFADEPTGNLDSKNGAKVMDILKGISKDRLVIVVSHNKKFNDIYADYTIELVDGKVVTCDLPTQVDESAPASHTIEPYCKSKLRPKTVARLAFWGIEKNKIKIIASMISFIIVSILSIIFTVAFIGDMPYAYAKSIQKSNSKNVMISVVGFSGSIDTMQIKDFKANVKHECAPFYQFAFEQFDVDNNKSKEFDQKYGLAPPINYGMAYNMDMGIDAEILFGDIPKDADDIMLPSCYAKYLTSVGKEYATDNMQDIIGKEITAYNNTFKICGIFEEGEYFTDFDDMADASAWFMRSNLMAQCVILAPQMDEFLYETASQTLFGKGAYGFYFNMKDVKNIYSLLRRIDAVGEWLNLWETHPMQLNAEGIFCLDEMSSLFHNCRYIVALPFMLVSFAAMLAMEYVSFSYLVSSKSKSYNILRSLGFNKKNIVVVLLVQILTIVVVECILGIALSALACHLFGKAYISLSSQGALTKFSTEVLISIGYIAPIIVTAVALLMGGIIVFAKTKQLFSKSIIENKTN